MDRGLPPRCLLAKIRQVSVGWASGAQRVNGTPSSGRSAKTVAGRTLLKFETHHVRTNQI